MRPERGSLSIPCRDSTPSSSVNSWFTTRSVTPVLSLPRLEWGKEKENGGHGKGGTGEKMVDKDKVKVKEERGKGGTQTRQR